jgi:hypothetical protein
MSNRVAAVAERVLKEAAAAGVSWQGAIVYAGGLAAVWAERLPEANFAAGSSPPPKKSPHGGK